MLTLSTGKQIGIGAFLVLLVVATRGQHVATLHSLPGASWAVFFLAGVYLRPVSAPLGLLALTWALDFAAFAGGGATGFCLTPAYGFLLPAYGALWLAGRWYPRRHRLEWRTLLPLAAAMVAGAAACELLSSGGFYFLSGRFAEPSFAEFGARLVEYFPSDLRSVALYVGIAAVVHASVALAPGAVRHRQATGT